MSEQARQQRGHGGFHAQDSLTELHRRESEGNQHFELIGNESAFGTDNQRHRLADAAGTQKGRMGMCDQGKRALDQIGQLVLNKGLEQRPEQDLGQDRVAGLLKTEHQLFMQTFGIEDRTFPKAFFDTECVQKDDSLDSHGACGTKDPSEHFRTRQAKNKRHGKGRGRRTLETNIHLKDRLIQENDFTGADPASDESHAELVPHSRAMHLEHMPQPAALQPDPRGVVNKILFGQEDKIHTGMASEQAGWTPAEGSFLPVIL